LNWLDLKLAWRNLFRNKRRTFITGTAIGIGLAAMILVDAIIQGMERNMIRSATSTYLGEGQIHADGFRATLDVDRTIEDFAGVTAGLEEEPLVDRFAARLVTFSMLSSAAEVEAVSMVGVDPGREPFLSQFDEALVEGEYIAEAGGREILLGEKLAELLRVDLRDRVVLTASQAGTGDLAQEMFRVSGIFHTGVKELDSGMALVGIERARGMLNLEGEAHEIALRFTNREVGRDREHPFWSRYSRGGNEAVGWSVLLPQLESAFALSGFSTFITGVILFSVVALGIINTLFMSLHERMFEFGVLRAIGMRPVALGRLVLLEAGSLAALSIVIGIALGLLVCWILQGTGIDYSGIEYAGVTFREPLKPILRIRQFASFPIYVFFFTTLIGLYPALYAARMTPAGAMRKSF
jgi:lipoprotein-releasing system permease protein